MIPREKYAVDTTTEVNGVTLKWTKQIKDMYEFGDGMDLSIAYTNYHDPVMWNIYEKIKWSDDRDMCMPDCGQNPSGANKWLSGWTRRKGLEPMTRPYMGFVLTDKVVNQTNSGCYVTGVNIDKKVVYETGRFGDRRILLGFDINKMLFNVRLWGYRVDDWDGIDYEEDPLHRQAPSTREITLGQLYEHPEDYEVTSVQLGSTWIYNEETGVWGSTTIYPALIMSDDGINTEGFSGDMPFVGQTPTLRLSVKDTEHIAITGGISSNFIYKMEFNYMLGFTDEFELIPFDPQRYNRILEDLAVRGDTIWGMGDDWSYDMYFYNTKYELGETILHFDTRAHPVTYRREPPEGELDHTIGDIISHGTLAIKGETICRYLAGFGLYYTDDKNYNPNNTHVTPETFSQDEHIMLGEMAASGVTTGNWIVGEPLDKYEGYNKDGTLINPSYNPSFPPAPYVRKGRKFKVILSEYLEQIKMKTYKRRT